MMKKNLIIKTTIQTILILISLYILIFSFTYFSLLPAILVVGFIVWFLGYCVYSGWRAFYEYNKKNQETKQWLERYK